MTHANTGLGRPRRKELQRSLERGSGGMIPTRRRDEVDRLDGKGARRAGEVRKKRGLEAAKEKDGQEVSSSGRGGR